MGTTLIDNFDYRGKRFLDSRQSVATLAELKAMPETDIPDGFRAYCQENALWYEFNSANTTDATTGKWRKSESGSNGPLSIELSLKKDASIGKNLFNKRKVTAGYFIGSNGDLSSYADYCVSEYIHVIPGEQYIISNSGRGGAFHYIYGKNFEKVGVIPANETFVTPENAEFVRLSIALANLDKIQMEVGDVATDYEPYTDDHLNDQRYAELNTKIDDKLDKRTHVHSNELTKLAISEKKNISRGKNLFDMSKIVAGRFILEDGTVSHNDNISLSDYIPVEPEKDYYLSGINTSLGYNAFYDKDLNFISSAPASGLCHVPSGVAYMRLTMHNPSISTTQLELGTSNSGYEPFTDDYNNQQQHEEIRKSVTELNTILTKAVLSIPDLVSGKNLVDPSAVTNGYLYQNGAMGGSSSYVTTDFISVTPGSTVTASSMATGPIYFCEYDESKVFIKSEKNNPTKTVTLTEKTAYIRASFVASNYLDSAQIEYGDRATEFEPYKRIISKAWLPEDIGKGATPEEVKEIISNDSFSERLVLPSTLYFKVGRQNNIYFNQAIKGSSLSSLSFSAIETSILKVFNRQMAGSPATPKTVNNRLSIRKGNRLVDELQCRFTCVGNQTSRKNIRILETGDSITDLGGWQAALKQLLGDAGVDVEYIGTMIHRVNIGTTQSPNYAEGILGEVLSGGNMSFIAEACGPAKILTVSGISEMPQTGYPGTSYIDGNGNSWAVRGYKLTPGEDGKFSGKIKIGKFRADPNYGDGVSDDTSETGVFPSSGILTKDSTLPGDSVIQYSSAESACFNPFWNPVSDTLDFRFYLDGWGFDDPDVMIMQWGYNEVGAYDDNLSENVQTAVSRAKMIIDKLHEQLPLTKVIFGIECYGREIPAYAGSGANTADAKKFSVLSLAQEMISLFESDTYKDYVILVPIYAMMDHIYGYGPVTEIGLCDLYSHKELVGQNGSDGVHPHYSTGGLREIGRAYEPAVLALLQ